MAEEYEDEKGQDFLDPAEVEPLFDALDDPAAEIRAVMFEALARLPLVPSDWLKVARFAARASESTSAEERRALIDVARWVPLRSLREHVGRLAEEDEDEDVRAHAARARAGFDADDAPGETTEGSPLRPAWASGRPPGFTRYSASERATAVAELARVAAPLERVPRDELAGHETVFGLDARIMAPVLERDLAPAAVTALFERARTRDWEMYLGNNIVGWVQGIQGQFRPDLEGLFSQYRRTALAECERWPDDRRPGAWFLWFPDFESWFGYRSLCWQIGWTVSRGGLRGLVPALAPHLRAEEETTRIAAGLLIADAADYASTLDAPIFGGGYGPERRVVSGFLEEPERPPEPATLRRTLREAALRGVIPATEAPVLTPAIAPSAPVEQPDTEPVPLPPPPSYPTRAEPATVGTRPRRSRPLPVLRFAVPLALLGGIAVAARWLFGWFVEAAVEPVAAATDIVECTVFSPPAAAPGASILVQAFVHLPEQADDARAIALEFDTDARRRTFHTLTSPVRAGSRLDFELRLPGLEVDDSVATLVWRRRAEAVQFGVSIPADAAPGTIIGTLAVSLDSAPLGHVKFKLAVEKDAAPATTEPQGEEARRYKVAFISYSSRDRDEVLRRVQVLSLVGVRYFQDVLSLEPGDRFSRRIELGIDECDLFLLFWSSDAKMSEWVRKEVRHALSRKAGDDLSPPEIRPVILEGPPIVEPWEELAHLHFDDRLLYFMRRPPAIDFRTCPTCRHENPKHLDFCARCGSYLGFEGTA